MNSPISSALRRFSMLSLTLCSWPARVWMTNHCVCMKSFSIRSFKYPPDQYRHDSIDTHRERAQKRQGHHDHDCRTLQLVHRWPGAFFQFLPRFGGVIRNTQKKAFTPGVKEASANDAHPKPQFNVPVHNLFKIHVWRRGRDSNPRWRLSHNGFQDRRDRPLCHPSGYHLWQGGRDSNRQPTVLETATLPIELPP